jgi:hypothetical protein
MMARFKAPKKVIFGELPKTSTGKIQNSCCASGRDRRARSSDRAMNAPLDTALQPLCLSETETASQR